MALEKDARKFGVPSKLECGYAQTVKAGDTIYVSAQLGHDETGNIIGAAPLDEHGAITVRSNTEVQMRQTYANARKTNIRTPSAPR